MRRQTLGTVTETGRQGRGMLVAGCVAVLFLAACEPIAPPAPPARSVQPAPAGITRSGSDKEYWDACYFEDVKVGSMHQQFTSGTENGKAIVKISAHSELTLHRFGETVRQGMELSTVETPEGELIRMTSRMIGAGQDGKPQEIGTKGFVEGDKLTLEISTLGKTIASSMKWDKSWGGYFAMEQTLERQPMKVGEKRKFRAIQAGFNQIADIEYEAIKMESTPLLDESRELLRIEAKIKIGDVSLEQTIWTDPSGQTIKSYMPAMKQASYRTTRERARQLGKEKFDLGERTIVPLATRMDNPHQSRSAVYRVSFTSGDPARSFATGATQLVKKIDDRTIELHVRSLRASDDRGAEFPKDQSPTDDDRAPNALIQSDDPSIAAIAKTIAPGKTDFWEIALAAEQYVKQHVATKNFSQALASAAEVARSGEGDCTEHAVLLAALCRAKQIPARVAIGLVYFPPAKGFAYHMWTEAWNQDRWIPLDATLGRGGIGAAHLRINSSSLKGADPLSQFLPVFKLIGNVQIQLISVN